VAVTVQRCVYPDVIASTRPSCLPSVGPARRQSISAGPHADRHAILSAGDACGRLCREKPPRYLLVQRNQSHALADDRFVPTPVLCVAVVTLCPVLYVAIVTVLCFVCCLLELLDVVTL